MVGNGDKLWLEMRINNGWEWHNYLLLLWDGMTEVRLPFEVNEKAL